MPAQQKDINELTKTSRLPYLLENYIVLLADLWILGVDPTIMINSL